MTVTKILDLFLHGMVLVICGKISLNALAVFSLPINPRLPLFLCRENVKETFPRNLLDLEMMDVEIQGSHVHDKLGEKHGSVFAGWLTGWLHVLKSCCVTLKKNVHIPDSL